MKIKLRVFFSVLVFLGNIPFSWADTTAKIQAAGRINSTAIGITVPGYANGSLPAVGDEYTLRWRTDDGSGFSQGPIVDTNYGNVSLLANAVPVDFYCPSAAAHTARTCLDDAVSTLGSTNQHTILIPNPQTISANLTITSNLTLVFQGSGRLDPDAGTTTTINGPIMAPLRQIFGGSGTVSLTTNRAIEKVPVEWWGAIADDSTDSTTAIQAALNNFGAVRLAKGTYKVTAAIDMGDNEFIAGSGYGSILKAYTNSQNVITINGSQAIVEDLYITKNTAVTGVNGIFINSTGDQHSNYNKITRVRIEGNGAGDLINNAILIQAGKNVAGADMGAWYNSIVDINIRYATNGVKLDTHSTNLANGANGTRAYNVRVGDSTTGWRITRADTASVWGFAAEGCTTGVIIETAGANNNDSSFYGPRFEANTTNIQVNATSSFNSFIGHNSSSAKITDNGGGTILIGSSTTGKIPGFAYTDVDATSKIQASNGVRIGQSTEYVDVVRKAMEGTSRFGLDFTSATGSNDLGILLPAGKGFALIENTVGVRGGMTSGGMVWGSGLGIGSTTGAFSITLQGNTARSMGMDRHSTANTAGNNLTAQAGGATSGATDKNGGDLILAPGTATGTGKSKVQLQSVIAGTTGTTDRSPATHIQVSQGHLVSKGTAPTLSACGTTPALTGNDISGKITIGGGGAVTSCTVTFSTAYDTNAPACTASGDNTAVNYPTTTTTTVLTITSSADMQGDVLSYICLGME